MCHRFGHRSYDCRFKGSGNYEQSVNSPRPPAIVCYFCNEPGHKAPDCKKKNRGYIPNPNESNGFKKPNLRKGSRQYNANWVAVQKGAAHVEGNINGIPCQIVPDTGAEITIVPACYVYEDQAINEWVKVRGWNGEPQTLQLTKVDF